MADTRSLGDMVDRIASEIERDDLGSSTNLGTAGVASIYNTIRDAVYFYQRETFWSNEVVDSTVFTTAGVSTVPFPAGLVSLTQLDLIRSGTVYPLKQELYQVIDSWDANSPSTRGTPFAFAMYGNEVRLYPTPDAVYPLRYIYYMDISLPVNATDVNFWTTEAEELIRNRAKYILHMTVVRQPEMAEFDKKMEIEAYKTLMTEVAAKLYSGTVLPTQF